MTAAQIIIAWREAQIAHHAGLSFYKTFAKKVGVDEAAVKGHFNDWNDLSHDQVQVIADRNGTTVREGGFQAYLAEVL